MSWVHKPIRPRAELSGERSPSSQPEQSLQSGLSARATRFTEGIPSGTREPAEKTPARVCLRSGGSSTTYEPRGTQTSLNGRFSFAN